MHEQCESIYYHDGYNRAVFRHNYQKEEANVQGCSKERAGGGGLTWFNKMHVVDKWRQSFNYQFKHTI